MNISNDIYEYLLFFLDNKTILNMLSVNKKFRDETLFERVMKKRYPLLKKKKCWKMFFIETIFYIEKLKEEFDIPYIPSKNFNPRKFYIKISDEKKEIVFDEALSLAAEAGRLDIVKDLVEKGGKDINWAMVLAARENHFHIIEFLVERGAKDFDVAMGYAALEGHINIVKYMIEKGATNFNFPMEWAAKKGHIEIVEYMIEKGATDFGISMEWAKMGKHENIVKLLETLIEKR